MSTHVERVEVTVSLNKRAVDVLEANHGTLSLEEIVKAYMHYAAAELLIAEHARKQAMGEE